jgi:hypothetical protein
MWVHEAEMGARVEGMRNDDKNKNKNNNPFQGEGEGRKAKGRLWQLRSGPFSCDDAGVFSLGDLRLPLWP